MRTHLMYRAAFSLWLRDLADRLADGRPGILRWRWLLSMAIRQLRSRVARPKVCDCTFFADGAEPHELCDCGHGYDDHAAGGQSCHAVLTTAPYLTGGES